MSLPPRSGYDDRKLLYAIAGFLQGASDQDFSVGWDDITGKPATFPPSPHTHVVAEITDFPTTWDWADLTGVPAEFPPAPHVHDRLTSPDGLSEITWNNSLQLTGAQTGIPSYTSISGINRYFALVAPDNGWSGIFQSQAGSWPGAQGQFCRLYAASSGNQLRVTYADGSQEVVQTQAFGGEAEGLPATVTPRDFMTQEFMWLRQVVRDFITHYNAHNPPGKPDFIYGNEPYPTHVARPMLSREDPP